MTNDLVIYNGKLISSEQINIGVDNRSFKYGDGLFESIRMSRGEVKLFNLHYNRLNEGLALLKLKAEDNFASENLLKQILRLKAIYTGVKDARIRISVYRNGGGLYTPNDNSFSYVIELTPLLITAYPLNNIGLKLDFFRDHKKSMDVLSNYKTNNALTSVLAGIYKVEYGLDEAIILNEHNRICETISSNLFLINHNNQIITPALSEACLNGVMRKFIIETLKETFEVIESEISEQDLLNAHECFLTNASRGIQWVEQIGNKTFVNTFVKQLHAVITEKLG